MSGSRTVLVTGGTRGIGKGIARVFCQQGDQVVVVGRDAEAGRACVAELAMASALPPHFAQADVRDRTALDALVAVVAERHGGLDVLCCNAGVFPQATLESMQEEEWESIFATNLKGMLFSIQACLPWLKHSGAGRIVLTSSITGPITGYPGWSHYGASKAGMLGFMRTAAMELAPFGITINAVMPGCIKTEAIAELGVDFEQSTARVIPLQRFGTPEEVGHAVAFFASVQASYVTGQTLVVDGGQVLPESPLCFES
jgi:3-oxoacyl-[acyl-carrier protein] reductase